jgi:HK97 family phage prohead protease
MTKNRETRRREIRAATIGGKPGVTLHAVTTGVVDDYGSFWMPDAFDESLGRRLPTLCWAHDWSEPLGPAVAFRAGANGPEVDFVFSEFEAVPMARRAHTQVNDGTIRDCSVGFWNAKRRDPTDEERAAYPGIREVIERAELDEVSLVLRGAVPGAKVLAVRSGAATIDMDAFMEIARRKAAGELTDAEAKAAIGLLADEVDALDIPNAPVEDLTEDPEANAAAAAEMAALEADADAALGLLGPDHWF